eukprot:CAMPEP_0196821494 /NCGR_PEP_ID=MMETSP1362-20130617/79426_1 /TAXON_ID=163516 /ORGANISM="Leptocylindrus danicus, Strain CCMP1856" /LENGTH=57 /DNA_ID=CAMNT_0042200695 /DNA_START=315 /DNA_END=488 /DNA_ORIENTATION=-
MVLIFAILIDFIAGNVKHIKSARLTKAATSKSCNRITLEEEKDLLSTEMPIEHDKND